MVTGDHALTAEAIARKCGIITTPTRREVAAEYGCTEAEVAFDDPAVQALVISGEMINEIQTDAEWDIVRPLLPPRSSLPCLLFSAVTFSVLLCGYRRVLERCRVGHRARPLFSWSCTTPLPVALCGYSL